MHETMAGVSPAKGAEILKQPGPIRVFLVDDSPVALVLLKRMLATSPDIQIVGTATRGRDALAQFPAARPKVICTDYHMPDMDGLALIQETMACYPRPILVISSVIKPADRDKAFPLLAAGAVDVFAKPSGLEAFEESAAQLVQKIKILSGVFVISRRLPVGDKLQTTPAQSTLMARMASPVSRITTRTRLPEALPREPLPREPLPRVRPVAQEDAHAVSPPLLPSAPKMGLVRMIAIGASTGGPQVLRAILSRLPANMPCPVLCVQHISAGFLSGLVDWLDDGCRARVVIARDGEPALPGTIYFPQEQTHLEIDSRGFLRCSPGPAIDGHRPSVTATFESVAKCYRHSAVAVLLTGMGNDGASGMAAICRTGGLAIAQDEASSVVYGMPRQAVMRGAAHHMLSPDEIAATLLQLVNR